MWARVDDGWWCHPKVMGLDLAARGLWVSALSWSCAQRTDRIPPTFPQMLGADEATAKQIEANGLWHGPGHDCDDCDPVEHGWIVHNWANYQEKSVSEKRAEAGRKGGKKSRPPSKQTPSKPEAKPEAGARPVPTQPDPKPKTLASAPPPLKAVPSSNASHPDLFKALFEVCGYTGTLTKSEGGRVGTAARELAEIGATPDDVRAKAKAYRTKWPDIDLTPTGLVANWNQVEADGRLRRGPTCPRCDQDPERPDHDEMCHTIARSLGHG